MNSAQIEHRDLLRISLHTSLSTAFMHYFNNEFMEKAVPGSLTGEEVTTKLVNIKPFLLVL